MDPAERQVLVDHLILGFSLRLGFTVMLVMLIVNQGGKAFITAPGC